MARRATAITAEVSAGGPAIPDRTSPRRSSFPAITARAGVTSAIAVVTASAATASMAKDAAAGRRVFDSGELQLVLLKLIADQPRHGYELIRAIEELTGGAYVPSPGVIYPTLTLLQDMGRIEEATAAGPRKAFAVTADGTAELVAKKPEVEALFARLAELASMRERTDGGPVRRAMGNLRTVLLDRLGRDGVQSETMHEVAAILDEAARKIERLCMTFTSSARVPTSKASRYLQQLCKHWSHNLARRVHRAEGRRDLSAQRARRRLAGGRHAPDAGA